MNRRDFIKALQKIEREEYFLPFQEGWIADESKLKAAKKARRVGFTFGSSYRHHRKCMKYKKGFDQWVSSRDMFTAQEYIKKYVKSWCEKSNIIAKGMYGDDVMVLDPKKDIKAYVCTYPNSNRIISLSSTPEAFAGKGGDVFLDEVDLHDESGNLIDMAMPCITWGGQLEMVSAYRIDGTKETPWAKLIAAAEKDNPQNISLHSVTIYDAIAQGLVEKINEVTNQNMTRDEFLKEMRSLCRTLAAWQSQFECVVQDAGGKLLPMAKITACEMDPVTLALMLAKYSNAPRFGGYDVARKQHAAAWHEYAQIGTGLFLADRYTWHDVSFDDQEAWISARMTDANKPRISRMAIDSTGIGMQMAERMAKKFRGRVDEVNLESHRRQELCLMFVDRLETRTIYFPGGDDQLRADLNGPIRGLAKNGALRIILPSFDITNDETGATEKSHCDEFMAAVLANSAADAGAGNSGKIDIVTRNARSKLMTGIQSLSGYSGSIASRRAL